MTTGIIIAVCGLLLFAYIFDLTASRTRIPSVILLLILGWGVRQITQVIKIPIPDLAGLLPFLGTLGLILIVLDGTLELELNKSKKSLIKKSVTAALLPIFALTFLMAFAFQYFLPGLSFKDALTNAVPFCVISSSIAIPSAKHLSKANREFITYESSLSDIFGVIFFNFIALNELSQSSTIAQSSLQLLIMIGVAFGATLLLAFLLSKIDHHIKFIPIILLVLLIYSIAKMYHLPALIFIMIFGLFLGNLDELKRFRWISILKPYSLNKEVVKFKELIAEATFLVRALFFLLFGFLIETREIINTDTFIWAVGIVSAMLIIRAIQFKISKIEMFPMLFIAPRGLINILLFLSIVPAQNIPLVNKSLLLQVILLTALVLMLGIMFTAKKTINKNEEIEEINDYDESPAIIK
jgi:Kef-type K+ transport system membrane component KefB